MNYFMSYLSTFQKVATETFSVSVTGITSCRPKAAVGLVMSI